MHRLLKPEVFSEFVRNFSTLDGYSRIAGPEIDRRLGITYPPYPEGLQVGIILSTFFHLPECVEEESTQIMLQQRAGEMIMGFLSFIRTRWPLTINHKLRISSEGKVLGSWFETVYALCLEVAPYIPVDRGENAMLGVDGPLFFHNCVKELAEKNGAISMLIDLYPPSTSHQHRGLQKSKNNREECGIYLKAIVTRIGKKELPAPGEGIEPRQLGYFGTLLHYSITASTKDDTLRRGAFNNFLKETKAYIGLVSSKKYAIARVQPNGTVALDRGKRGGKIKLTLQTPDMPRF